MTPTSTKINLKDPEPMDAKKNLDQYYTDPAIARFLTSRFAEKVPPEARRVVIEPSSGRGAFYYAAHTLTEQVFGYDLEPKHLGCQCRNFFDVSPFGEPSETSVIGNPPYGRNASLAVAFMNHAATMANTIAFILPPTFRKDSVVRRLDPRLHLALDLDLAKNLGIFTLGETRKFIPSVFQVWVAKERDRVDPEQKTKSEHIEFVSKASAVPGTTYAVRRVGGDAGRILDGLNHKAPSTFFINSSEEVRDIIKHSAHALKNNIATVGMKSFAKSELIRLVEENITTASK